MAMAFADKCINGTWAEIWVNDEKIAEATGLQAKIEKITEDVKMCGYMFQDRKVVGYKGSGSLKTIKTTTRWQKANSDIMKTGIEPRYTLIIKLADPAAKGQERIVLKGVAFDDFTITDFEVGKVMNLELPFSFVDYEYLDVIE